jgi:hypothetical protein
MKVLVSAIACTPYSGSESYFGWSVVQCLARDHDLWVLTSGRNRPDFDRALAEGLVPSNIHFSYANRFKEWPANRMKARLQCWIEYRDYSQDIPALAQALHQTVHFDLVHHVTIATGGSLRRCGDWEFPWCGDRLAAMNDSHSAFIRF